MSSDHTSAQQERTIDALPDSIAELVRRSSIPGIIPGASDTAGEEEPATGRIGGIKIDVRLEFPTIRIAGNAAGKLKPGASIPLNDRSGDIVHVVVCDKVIARGEIVVVDGCYGVRITEFV